MARLFGALANAGAQVNTNRFKRQQYDDQQAAQARDEARRVFEFAATQDRLKEQAALHAQARKDALDRQNQNDQRAALESGFEDTPVESLAAASQAYMQSQGMGMPQQAVRAPQTARRVQNVEGVDASAAQKGAPAYATVGGRVMRYDPQREANNEADVRKSKLMEQFAMKRDVAGQLAADKDARRAELQAIINAGRPQPQEKKDLWTDGKGGYLRLGMDDPIPAGFQPVRSGGAGATSATGAGFKQQAEALKDLGSQLMAMAAPGGGLPSPTLMSRALKNVADDKTPGVLSAAASAAYGSTTGIATQKIDNLRAQVKAILLPMQGGKAITANEERVIIGAFEDVANAPEELREQRVRAMEVAIAPIAARVLGQPDYNQTIAEMRQRAQSYRPKSAGTTTKQAAPPSMQQGETREQRIKRLSGSR